MIFGEMISVKITALKGIQRFFTLVISLFVCFCIVFTPAIALAYNPDLLDDEIYWIDKGTTVSYTSNSYFQGFTKYIANKDDKCFYLFSKFTDYRIDTSSNDNITFSFAIENEVHKYSIQVDKNGVLESSGQNVFNAFNVYYNFDNANCKKQGGGVFIALEFKDAIDKTLTNKISCEYFCGNSCTYDLFDNAVFDLYVPTTTKPSTTKSTTAKQTDSNRLQSSEKCSSTKATVSKSTTEKSTKFSATGSYSINNTTRYITQGQQSADSNYSANMQEVISENTVEAQEEMVEDTSATLDYDEIALSPTSKALIVVFGVVLVTGITCMLIGAFSNKKKSIDKEETENINE